MPDERRVLRYEPRGGAPSPRCAEDPVRHHGARLLITSLSHLSPADPTRLVPYSGPPLTVGGELNKLATNYAFGRNWAGIHWRTDAAASLALGEEVAISLLRDERRTFREPFEGFTFTRFDGKRVTV
ncbi:hypothetical protein WMF15_00950 [Sorangium sp. So ce233]